MGYLPWILMLTILWISGCASAKTTHVKSKNLTMTEVYAQSMGQAQKDVGQFVERQLQEQKTFGYTKPYIPVINQPVVRKVWIPDHKSNDNPDVMIAGHWVYLMIQPSTWFIEGRNLDISLPVIIPSPPQALEKKDVP